MGKGERRRDEKLGDCGGHREMPGVAYKRSWLGRDEMDFDSKMGAWVGGEKGREPSAVSGTDIAPNGVDRISTLFLRSVGDCARRRGGIHRDKGGVPQKTQI